MFRRKRAKTVAPEAPKTKGKQVGRRPHHFENLVPRSHTAMLRGTNQDPCGPKYLDTKLVNSELKRFYQQGYDTKILDSLRKYAESVVNSYPQTEILASNSNLMSQVVVKPKKVAIATFEKGVSIYEILDDRLDYLTKDGCDDMYLVLELSQDCSKVFSYKFTQEFEFQKFDLFRQKFEVVQDLKQCFEGLYGVGGGSGINRVLQMRFKEAIGVLAVLVEFQDLVCVCLLRMVVGGRDEVFEMLGEVDGTRNASFVEFSGNGDLMFVGFDLEQKSGYYASIERKEHGLRDRWEVGGQKIDKNPKNCEIKIFKLNPEKNDLKGILGYELWLRLGEVDQIAQIQPRIKSISVNQDSTFLAILTTEGLLTVYKAQLEQESTALDHEKQSKTTNQHQKTQETENEERGLKNAPKSLTSLSSHIKGYKAVQRIQDKTSKLTIAQISSKGNFLVTAQANGVINVYKRFKNHKIIQENNKKLNKIEKNSKNYENFFSKTPPDNASIYAIHVSTHSETRPIKHCHITEDETKLIFESKHGVVKTQKIENLEQKKDLKDDSQKIRFGDHTEVSWLQFGHHSTLLVASVRNLGGNGESYNSFVFERDMNGVYQHNVSFDGNAYKMGFSDDSRLFMCVCYPKKIFRFLRDSEGMEYVQGDLELFGEAPYALAVIPGSMDVVVSTMSRKLLFYVFDEKTKIHALTKTIEGELGQLASVIKPSSDGNTLIVPTINRKIKFAQRAKTLKNAKKMTLDYRIMATTLNLDEIPTEIVLSEPNNLLLACLNNGSIQVFAGDIRAPQTLQNTQKIKFLSPLGGWNDIRAQPFNSGNLRYMFCHMSKDYAFSPHARSELILFCLNNSHVEKIDSYGILDRFAVGADFGWVGVFSEQEMSVVRLANLRRDFEAPQSKEMADITLDYFRHAMGSSEVNETLRAHSHCVEMLLSDQGRRMYSLESPETQKIENSKNPNFTNSEPKEINLRGYGANPDPIPSLKHIGGLFSAINTQNSLCPWSRLVDEMRLHSQFALPISAFMNANVEYLHKYLRIYGYRPLFYPDGFDPLDLALHANDIDLLDSICGALTSNPTNMAYLMSRIDLQLFVKIMTSSSFSLKKAVLEHCFVEPRTCSTLPIHSYPLRSTEEFVVNQMRGLSISKEIRRNIEKDAWERLKLNQAKVRTISFRLGFDPCLYSESAYLVLRGFSGIPDELKTGPYQYVVKHLWSSSYSLICLYSLFVLFTSALFCIYVIWCPGSLAAALLSSASCLLLLAFELCSLVANAKAYFGSYYNWLDLYIYLARPLIVVLSHNGVVDEKESEVVSTWVNLTILIAGFRTMGELRVFSSTRVLMAMISQVVNDMIAFIVITVTIVVLFSVVAANTYKNDPEKSIDTFKDFSLLMHHYYNVASGSWEGSIEEMRASELFNFYLSGIALFVLMINLLIAVISLTFDNFQDKQELHDLEELYEVMIGHCHVAECFRKLACRRRLKQGRRDKRKKTHPRGSLEPNIANRRGKAPKLNPHFLYIIREESNESQVDSGILRELKNHQTELLSRISEMNNIHLEEVKKLLNGDDSRPKEQK